MEKARTFKMSFYFLGYCSSLPISSNPIQPVVFYNWQYFILQCIMKKSTKVYTEYSANLVQKRFTIEKKKDVIFVTKYLQRRNFTQYLLCHSI